MYPCLHSFNTIITHKKAVLSQEVPREAAAYFDTYRVLKRHRAVFTAIKRLSSLKMENSRQNRDVKYVYLLPSNSLFASHSLNYKH